MSLSFSAEENYRKNCVFLAEERKNCPAFSADGYIEDQRTLSKMPYAAKDSAYCGCGWIALWNLLKASGREVFAPELIREAEKATLLRGVLGTSPFGLKKLAEKYGFSPTLFFSEKRFIKKRPEKGIIMYVRKNLTAHYVAFTFSGNDLNGETLYRFYNAGFCGEELSLPEFFRRQKHIFAFCYDIK